MQLDRTVYKRHSPEVVHVTAARRRTGIVARHAGAAPLTSIPPASGVRSCAGLSRGITLTQHLPADPGYWSTLAQRQGLQTKRSARQSGRWIGG